MSTFIDQQLQATGVAQVIVTLKWGGTTVAAGAAAGASAGAAATAATNLGAAARRLAGNFVESEGSQLSSIARATVAAAALGAGRARHKQPPPSSPMRVFPHLGVMLGTVSRAGLAALQADGEVATVTGAPQISLIRPDRVAAARVKQGRTWGIDALRVPELWAAGLTGQGIRVAHLDTGVDGRHPTLRKAVTRFAEFDFQGRRITPDPAPHDSDEHGTHTAATIAGRPVKGSHVGVAFEAELASGLVIEGGAVVARVLGGMDWAIEQGARILSMSLGFRGWWEDFVPIIAILRARGILPVIAAGNEGPGTSRSPGNYPEALSVGAMDKSRLVPGFSSSQTFARPDPLVPDLIAPGVDVISAKPGNAYQSMDGTSMATPHMAGLAALLWQAKPAAAAAEIERAIFSSCTLPPHVLPDRAHRGVPDGVAAFTALTGNIPAPLRVQVAGSGRAKRPATKRKTPARKPASRGGANRR